MTSVGLELAGQKTEAVLITGRKVREIITLIVGKNTIICKPHIWYLGVVLDAWLSFKDHMFSAM